MTTNGLEKHRGLSERDFDILNCLNALQAIYNGAKTQRLHALDRNMMKEFTEIINTFIEALKIYASRLPLRAPTKYNPATECKILSEELMKSTAANNNSPDTDSEDSETFNNEKLFYERQMLAVIALLCSDFSNTTQTLLFEKCEEHATGASADDEMDAEQRIGSFVDIFTDILCTIGHSVSFCSRQFEVKFGMRPLKLSLDVAFFYHQFNVHF